MTEPTRSAAAAVLALLAAGCGPAARSDRLVEPQQRPGDAGRQEPAVRLSALFQAKAFKPVTRRLHYAKRKLITRSTQVKKVSAVTDARYPLRPAPRGSYLLMGRPFVLRTSFPALNRAIIALPPPGTRKREFTDPGRLKHALIDLSDGRTVGALEGFHTPPSPCGAYLQQRKAALNLVSGERVKPRVQLPGDRKVVDVEVWSVGGARDLWIFAKSSDKKVFYGPWDPGAGLLVTLTRLIPHEPTHGRAFVDGGIEVFKAENPMFPVLPNPTSLSCERHLLRRDKRPHCIYSNPTLKPPWSALTMGHGPDSPLHALKGLPRPKRATNLAYPFNSLTAGVHRAVPDICLDRPVAHVFSLRDPPRILNVCTFKDHRLAVLWSPQRIVTFRLPVSAKTVRRSGRRVRGSIQPLSPSDKPARSWVDLDAGRAITTPLLLALGSLGGGRALATRRQPSGSQELVLLDVKRGAAQLIARYDDCRKGELKVGRFRGELVVISCEERPDKDRWVFSPRWSEVLDLRARHRWRIDGVVERLLPGRRALVSDRARYGVESVHSMAYLQVVTLPAAAPAKAGAGDLLARLKDPRSGVAAKAARALGYLRPKDAAVVTALGTALGHHQRGVRLEAAWALRQLGPRAKPALGGLLRLLRSGDAQQRIAAIQAIQAIQTAGASSPAAADHLARELAQPKTRLVALKALVQLGERGLKRILEQLIRAGDADGRLCGAIRRFELPQTQVPLLIAGTRSPKEEVRICCVTSLPNGDGSKPVVEAVAALMADSRSGVQHAAVWTAGYLAPAPALVSALQGVVSKGIDRNRRAALRSLARLNAPPAVDALLQSLNKLAPADKVRTWALKELHSVAGWSGPALQRLGRVLRGGKGAGLRLWAATILAGTRKPLVVQALSRAVADRDPRVQRAALFSLNRICYDGYRPVPLCQQSPLVARAYTRGLRSRSAYVRQAGVTSLGAYCRPSASPRGRCDRGAVMALQRALRDRAIEVRKESARTLGVICGKPGYKRAKSNADCPASTSRALIRALRADREVMVREASASALGRICALRPGPASPRFRATCTAAVVRVLSGSSKQAGLRRSSEAALRRICGERSGSAGGKVPGHLKKACARAERRRP